MRIKPNKYDKYLVFTEEFKSVKTVSDNWAIVTGVPTIDNGTTTTASGQLVAFANTRTALYGATSATIRIKFKTGSDVTSTTDLVTRWGTIDGSCFSIDVSGGALHVYVASSKIDGGANVATLMGIQPNTQYNFFFVYNGAGATNADRLKLYSDCVLTPFSTFAGTIASSLTTSSARLIIFGYENGSVEVAGIKINRLDIFNTAFTADEVLDVCENDTFTELDKPTISLPLRNAYVAGGLYVTGNNGSLNGTVTMGDGMNSTSAPKILNPHGAQFDGGDWINTRLMVDTITPSTPFTFAGFVKNLSLTAGVNQGLIGTIDTAQDFKGWEVGVSNVASVPIARVILCNASSGGKIMAVTATLPAKVTGSLICTYDGSGVGAGVKIYFNGDSLTTTVTNDTLSGNSIANGKSVIVGARWNGTSTTSNLLAGSNVYNPTMYNFAVNPIQVRTLNKKLYSALNI